MVLSFSQADAQTIAGPGDKGEEELVAALMTDDATQALFRSGERLAQAKVAAQTPVPAERGAMKSTTFFKKPAAAIEQRSERNGASQIVGKLRVASTKGKAYLTSQNKDTKKWHHVVTVYATTPSPPRFHRVVPEAPEVRLRVARWQRAVGYSSQCVGSPCGARRGSLRARL